MDSTSSPASFSARSTAAERHCNTRRITRCSSCKRSVALMVFPLSIVRSLLIPPSPSEEGTIMMRRSAMGRPEGKSSIRGGATNTPRALTQQDRQEHRGILEPAQRMRLPALEVEHLAGLQDAGVAVDLDHDLAGQIVVVADLFARRDDQADDLQRGGLHQRGCLGLGQGRSQRADIDYFTRLCVWYRHRNASWETREDGRAASPR